MITEMQEVAAQNDTQPLSENGSLQNVVDETSGLSFGGQPAELSTAELSNGDLLRDSRPGDLKWFLEQRLRRRSRHIYAEALAMMERYVLTRVLQETKGNQSEASRLLGITRGCLRNRIRTLHIVLATNVILESPGSNGAAATRPQPR